MAAQTSTDPAARASRSAPVFFDARGRRWRRILTVTGLAFIAGTAVVVPLTVSAVRPVWTMAEHRDNGYLAQLLNENSSRSMPVLGDEGEDDLARVDLVQRRAGRTILTDPFSGRVIRTATADEAT